MRTRPLAVVLAVTPFFGCGARVKPPDPAALFPFSTLWVAPVEDLIEGPLAADERRIFVTTRGGALLALDQGTGDVVWRVEGRRGQLAGSAGALFLRQGDGTLFALQPRTGAPRWKADTGVPGTLPPVIDRDYVLVAGTGLAAVEAASGKVVWSIREKTVASTPPVPAGASLLVGEEDGTLRCRDRATGVSLWVLALGSPLLATPVVDDETHVFLGTTSRRLLSLGMDKGKERWHWKVGADVRTPAAVLGDMALFVTYEAVLYALKRSNGNMAWRSPLPSRPLSGPIAQGDAVLVACHETDIVGVDPRTGRRVGVVKTPAEMLTVPILTGGRLFVGLRNRTVIALQLGSGAPAPSPAQPES